MADLIFTGGPIVTVDTRRPRAEALAVADGRIRALGSHDEMMREHRTPETHVIELAGRALLPGFVEPHGHPTLMAMALAPPAVDVRPFTVPNGAEVIEAIRREAAAAEPGTPLCFYGIDVLLQPGLTPPTRAELDELAPRNPVVVVADSGHAAYANSAMLEVAGAGAADPAAFVRDDDGTPTGEGRGGGAVALLMAPATSAAGTRFPVNMRWAYGELARAGFTTVTDMAYGANLHDRLALLAEDPDCKVRLRAYESGRAALAGEPGHRLEERPDAGPLFAQIGMKLWADGSPMQGTIATSFPYLDTDATRALGLEPGHRGGLGHDPEELADLAVAFTRQGYQLACHVQGDVAADAVLDAYERALTKEDDTADAADTAGPPADPRPRLEHCGALTAEQFARAAALGATVSLFPQQLYYWGDVLAGGLFGEERAASWMAARSALDAGLRISFHNDGTVTPPDPLGNIATAVTRTTRGGRVLGPAERISVEEALRAQTLDAAWQLHLEDEIGSLAEGKRADLVVLGTDPLACAPEDIREINVVATYLGGRQTHGVPL